MNGAVVLCLPKFGFKLLTFFYLLVCSAISIPTPASHAPDQPGIVLLDTTLADSSCSSTSGGK